MTVTKNLIELAKKMNNNPKGISGVNRGYKFDLNGDEEDSY